ncbi:MAG: bifunctional sulfate adenylyltransferase/adenylylsulfate kinase [Chromatiales bacterium]|jgi:sulfate adenylyltransferase|nr:bifunctional sulfate adenylyltransferase/adenylylsulfate kinase [Chromatiales bacterium]MDX9767406.1 bifunctional sulfate adenylyltransferase/adenylylsulfate kinase [Ectothiorhodospiraceae bacterium]
MSGSDLIPPHGGRLCERIPDLDAVAALRAEALQLPSWDLNPRQVCDIELLLNGGFSPLTGYPGQADYESICARMRLADGTLWPMPVTLDVSEAFASGLAMHDRVALRHPEGMLLAILTVDDLWRPDRRAEAIAVYGSDDDTHPGVFALLHQSHPVYLGGRVDGIELPPRHTFKHLRHGPAELRALFARLGWARVVAFHADGPMHRAQMELTRRAAAQVEANLLLHAAVGVTHADEVDDFHRVRCHQAALQHYPEQTTQLSLLPLNSRRAGPREALWHAIIRQNHGCSHFIVGPDHAAAGVNRDGRPFYASDAAWELLDAHASELGIDVVPLPEMMYVEERAQYLTRDEVPAGARVLSLPAQELQRRLREGLEIPDWFSCPEVVEQLRHAFPPRHQQGFTVFFTGLSGSGKSTIANVLFAKLMELGTRPVTLLDGDIVRKNLSSELGFSREHREINVRRIGFVASEITKNGGVAICAPIAPYAATRREVREMIASVGGFVEVHVATPLAVCEARDRKGLYARARAGLIPHFTGIDDPYEIPQRPEMTVDTSGYTAEDIAQQILLHLEAEGYIRGE